MGGEIGKMCMALVEHAYYRGVEIEITRGQHCGAKIQLGATRISISVKGLI